MQSMVQTRFLAACSFPQVGCYGRYLQGGGEFVCVGRSGTWMGQRGLQWN